MSAHTDWLTLDAENRLKAIDASRSLIIEAPAGAGKTELLTQRFLSLLAQVNDPEEIVALTFTNKAAAEMRERILRSLETAHQGSIPHEPHRQQTDALARAALARDKARGWQLLAHPGRLQVTTLDALCGRLARHMPLLSRLGSQPAIATDPTPHYEQAARDTLAWLHSDHPAAPVVARVLDRFDNDHQRLHRALVQMLARRDQWLPKAGVGLDLRRAERALAACMADEMQELAAHWPAEVQRECMPAARLAAASPAGATALAPLTDWHTPLQGRPEELPMWRSLAALLLTQAGSIRARLPADFGFGSAHGKVIQQHLKPVLDALREGRAGPALGRLAQIPDPVYAEAEHALLNDLLRLLKWAAAQLWLCFQRARVVDFIDMTQTALHALGQIEAPSDLQLQLDYRISHLLVDEFQDTSPTQVALLERLTGGWQAGDGRTVFVVGDPMQSIYRFRKADVGLFLRIRARGLSGIPLTALHLYRNNRSSPAVIDWVNRVFPQVMPPHDDLRRGGVRFAPATATREPHPMAGVHWHLQRLAACPDSSDDQDPGEDPGDTEAAQMLAVLAECQRTLPNATVAVLVRARSHLEPLVRALRTHTPALRFQAVDIEPLADRQIVQDALSLTQALHHLGDRLHWLAVLRAPWCGLKLDDLHTLCADDHQSTIWALMNDSTRYSQLSPDGQYRLAHARHVLGEALSHQGRQRPRRWVEGTWQALGGPLCAESPGALSDVMAFFNTLDGCERHGLIDFRALKRALEQLFAEPDASAGGGVQLMTIHKSKGLEFDVVLLPGLHRQPAQADRPLLLWDEVLDEEGHEQLMVAAQALGEERAAGTPSKYDYLYRLEQARARHESERLLYVAATRARHQLHLFGTVKLDPRQPSAAKPPHKDSLLALLWHDALPHVSDAAQPVPRDTLAPAIAQTPPRPPLSSYAHRLVRLANPSIPTPLRSDASPSLTIHPHTAVYTPDRQHWNEHRRSADMGTLVHRYLQRMALDGVAAWPLTRLHSLHAAMQRWLEAQGHASADAATIADDAVQHLACTVSSEEGQWVLAPHPEAQSEWAISSQDNGSVVWHVIDRTFVHEGVRWIVDYKTTADTQMNAEPFRAQLDRYADALAESRPVRRAILFTAYGRLVQLDQSPKKTLLH